jgi:Na+/H+-dicarboxylate symporter
MFINKLRSISVSGSGAIFLALILGITVGTWFGSVVEGILPIAKIVIQLIKAMAIPLVAFVILDGIIHQDVQGKDFGRLLIVALINGVAAIAIGIVLANLFDIGHLLAGLTTETSSGIKKVEIGSLLFKQVPSSILGPFVENEMIGVVLVICTFGFALRKIANTKEYRDVVGPLLRLIPALRALCELVIIWIVKLVPLAVFCATAHAIHHFGWGVMIDLLTYALVCIAAMMLHVLVVYQAWIKFYVRCSLIKFWKHALEPIILSFGVNSSLVALPTTLKTLDRLGVSRRASSLVACIGTNLNNDGIILYEGFTFIIIAQAMGFDLSLSTQILSALICVIAAMGVAGVPEAGVVALTLVLSTFGIPDEMLAILLSVDWLIARCRSAANVASDLTGSMVIDRAIR